ncbi:NAD(P)-binding domain protein [Cordyceps fumosorosea ARSEF 2679]|uniref:NAD(P)-binding domain protein n=1 Tax=Cordyceps fumosorosea (strain ARSEF 2679) TaxID=1081104 RepID=A0A167PLW4_CORFA|nr:NAD(P)-binding domain protein [Cordyceps fumosorosea ARSEF 2679]OAA56798.1 NAD(P)-binding domain protein [Cordyceps fumosorosea ARSEF 2679]
MATKIFITAGTGYVGGSVLDALTKRHPEYAITALLRSVPEDFAALYPNVRVIQGTFDDTKLIEDTAAENDIVIHGGKPKHLPSLTAQISGLLRRSKPGPGFLIRLAGTGIIADWQDGPYAVLNPKVWSDVDDIDVITGLPETCLHRPADKILQDAATQHGDRLKTAIITPSGIYGPGKGPGNVRSLLIPEMCENIIELGHGFYAEQGANRRSWIHVDDVVNVYLKLVEAAAAGGGNAVWGKEGYYFATTQELSQLDLAKAAGEILHKHGLIPAAEPKSLSVADVREMRGGSSWGPMGVYTWACNTRVRPDRATSLLGFTPTAPSVLDTLEQDLLDAVEHVQRNGPTYCPTLKI